MATPDAQRAFVELLARPLLTPANDPDAHRLVTQHNRHVSDAARRLGYRVQVVGRAVRLVRTPLAGHVAAPTPPLPAPARRTLAMVCVLAAACEDLTGGVTLAKLSDAVAELTAAPGSRVSVYQPGQLSHRRELLRASRVLEHWGVLNRRMYREEFVEEWTKDGAGIGAGYEVDRDALLLLTAPEVIDVALHPEPAEPDALESTRTLRLLRTLTETPAVVYGDLDPADADVLRNTRGLRSREVTDLVGGHVEPRAEGLVLILPDDPASPATVDWPRAAVGDWVALLLADQAGRAGTRQPDGTVTLTEAQVVDEAEDLRTCHNAYLTKDLRGDTAAVRAVAEERLVHLGLLRLPETGGWVLSPVAGRYRDPAITKTGHVEETS
jgi:uncharacterized protein (TIGR02678 family)